MDDGLSFDSVFAFLKRNLFLSGLTVIGLVLLATGFLFLREQQESESSVIFETLDTEETIRVSENPEKIMVDIGGAVERPGVYELDADSRVQDVLSMAGGLSEKADHQAIAKSMNLAAKVTDGTKLYFPHKGESLTASFQGMGASQTGESTATRMNGLIELNTASQAELESLPGIGEVTAKKIIDGRPYGSIDDLKTKKIIGDSVYGKIKDSVTVQY